MDNIKLSIVVPVYNGASFLEACYEQLANQTLDNIEIIIVDDGSTDTTAEIGASLAKNYNNCFFYHQENKGAAGARNFGVTKANGKYIGFVDVDDKYDYDMYEILYSAAIENDLDIATMDNYGPKGSLTVFEDKKKILDLFLCKGIRISACYKIYKKTLFPEMNFPEGIKMYEDFMAVYKGLNAASKIGLVNVNKYHYIHREGSSSRAKIFNKNYFQTTSVVDKVCKEIISQFPELEDSCKRRKAITYLRLVKVYYLRKHPNEYYDQIIEIKSFLKTISFKEACRYYSVYDLTRHYLCLYALPLFMLLIKTIDKE